MFGYLQIIVNAIHNNVNQKGLSVPGNAINGLGQIGKLVLRDIIDTGMDCDLVLLNDPIGNVEQHALLKEFDSVHSRWSTPVAASNGALKLNGQCIRLMHEKTIEALPFAELGVDPLIDCTNMFKN